MGSIGEYDEITMNNVATPEENAVKADMTNAVKVEGEHDMPEAPTAEAMPAASTFETTTTSPEA